MRIQLTVDHEPARDMGARGATPAPADEFAARPATLGRGTASVTYYRHVDDRSAAERPPRTTSAWRVETTRALR